MGAKLKNPVLSLLLHMCYRLRLGGGARYSLAFSGMVGRESIPESQTVFQLRPELDNDSIVRQFIAALWVDYRLILISSLALR